MPKQIVASANVFLVSDVQLAATYYRDSLGFRFDRFWGEPPDFCMTWRDDHCIMLSQVKDATQIRSITAVNSSVWDAYFWVTDADEMFDEFKKNSAQVVYEPFLKPYGVREFVVRDLDGHQLAFGHDMEK